MCRSKNAGVAGYAEAFRPVHSNPQTSEWYSYFENDVLGRLVRYLVCPKKLSWRLNALLHVIESQSFTRNTDQRTRYDTNMCK